MLGPNLAVYGYQDPEEVVRVLNKDSQVLVTAVMGEDEEQVSMFGQRLNCPLVQSGFGTHQISYDVPIGGKYLLGNSNAAGSISVLSLASITIERKANPVLGAEFPDITILTE